MDPNLLKGVLESIPKINPRIANGVAYEQLRELEQYVDKVIESTAKNFPEGLEYKGFKACTPREEFNFITNTRDKSGSTCDISRSNFYMVRYDFTYDGEPIYRYLYLPFVEPGGLMWLQGRRLAIQPVLVDTAFSYSDDSIFIHLTRSRCTFGRVIHHHMVDDENVSTYVAWSWLHHETRARNKKLSANKAIYSSLANYLFAQHGFTQAVLEYTGADVVVGTATDINRKNYPIQEWVICSTNGRRPKALSDQAYTSTGIRIAVRREQYTTSVEALIGGFYYIIDHFPSRIHANQVDNPTSWKITLGLTINKPNTGLGTLIVEVDDHLASLNDYIDPLVSEDFNRGGYPSYNINEMLMYIIEEMNKPMIAENRNVASLYDKHLVTKRRVLSDIVEQTNKLMYNFSKAAKKGKKLDINKIISLFNDEFKLRRIAEIRAQKYHPEVASIQCATDNMFIGITSAMLQQDNASASNQKKTRINLRDPSKHLHVSLAEVASYNNMPKSDPTGRSKINPFVTINAEGKIMRKEEFKRLLDITQAKIAK